MKLTKHVSVAAASLALTVAAVNAKPAQAATVKFLGQEVGNPNKYNYGVFADSNKEKLKPLSSITLSQLSGVTGVSVETPSAYQVVTNTFDTVVLLLSKLQTGNKNQPFSALNFSVFSKFTTPGSVPFAIVNGKNAGTFGGDTTGPVNVPEPMTVGGSLLAVGMAAWMKRKKAELAAKA
ncbi:hypothetical protein NIES22_28620 [Calothrix brevissima NIES-22]|nr:hypothetical protein NIES22_28620 [Calothrix brevissima NIES-22]